MPHEGHQTTNFTNEGVCSPGCRVAQEKRPPHSDVIIMICAAPHKTTMLWLVAAAATVLASASCHAKEPREPSVSDSAPVLTVPGGRGDSDVLRAWKGGT